MLAAIFGVCWENCSQSVNSNLSIFIFHLTIVHVGKNVIVYFDLCFVYCVLRNKQLNSALWNMNAFT